MSKVLITAPLFDVPTKYTYEWATEARAILNERAQELDLTIDMIEGEVAVREQFTMRISEYSPTTILHFDHGVFTALIGHKGAPLVDISSSEILAGHRVYAFACESARVFGPKAIEQGCLVYLGYNELFGFTIPYISTFKDVALLPVRDLSEGKTFGEAYENLYRKLTIDIQKYYSKYRASNSYVDYMTALWLYRDRRGLTLLGDETQTLTTETAMPLSLRSKTKTRKTADMLHNLWFAIIPKYVSFDRKAGVLSHPITPDVQRHHPRFVFISDSDRRLYDMVDKANEKIIEFRLPDLYRTALVPFGSSVYGINWIPPDWIVDEAEVQNVDVVRPIRTSRKKDAPNYRKAEGNQKCGTCKHMIVNDRNGRKIKKSITARGRCNQFTFTVYSDRVCDARTRGEPKVYHTTELINLVRMTSIPKGLYKGLTGVGSSWQNTGGWFSNKGYFSEYIGEVVTHGGYMRKHIIARRTGNVFDGITHPTELRRKFMSWKQMKKEGMGSSGPFNIYSSVTLNVVNTDPRMIKAVALTELWPGFIGLLAQALEQSKGTELVVDIDTESDAFGVFKPDSPGSVFVNLQKFIDSGPESEDQHVSSIAATVVHELSHAAGNEESQSEAYAKEFMDWYITQRETQGLPQATIKSVISPKVSSSEMITVYHGTTRQDARVIRKNGISGCIGEVRHSNKWYDTKFYLTTNFGTAARFAEGYGEFPAHYSSRNRLPRRLSSVIRPSSGKQYRPAVVVMEIPKKYLKVDSYWTKNKTAIKQSLINYASRFGLNWSSKLADDHIETYLEGYLYEVDAENIDMDEIKIKEILPVTGYRKIKLVKYAQDSNYYRNNIHSLRPDSLEYHILADIYRSGTPRSHMVLSTLTEDSNALDNSVARLLHNGYIIQHTPGLYDLSPLGDQTANILFSQGEDPVEAALSERAIRIPQRSNRIPAQDQEMSRNAFDWLFNQYLARFDLEDTITKIAERQNITEEVLRESLWKYTNVLMGGGSVIKEAIDPAVEGSEVIEKTWEQYYSDTRELSQSGNYHGYDGRNMFPTMNPYEAFAALIGQFAANAGDIDELLPHIAHEEIIEWLNNIKGSREVSLFNRWRSLRTGQIYNGEFLNLNVEDWTLTGVDISGLDLSPKKARIGSEEGVSNISFGTIYLTDCTLNDVNFSGVIVGSITLDNCVIRNTDFSVMHAQSFTTSSEMTGVNISNAKLGVFNVDRAFFQDTISDNVTYNRTEGTLNSRSEDDFIVSFRDLLLNENVQGFTIQRERYPRMFEEQRHFKDLHLEDLDLSAVNLATCSFTNVDMINCKFRNAHFDNTVWNNVDVTESDFTGATFEEVEITGTIKGYDESIGLRLPSKIEEAVNERNELIEFESQQERPINLLPLVSNKERPHLPAIYAIFEAVLGDGVVHTERAQLNKLRKRLNELTSMRTGGFMGGLRRLLHKVARISENILRQWMEGAIEKPDGVDKQLLIGWMRGSEPIPDGITKEDIKTMLRLEQSSFKTTDEGLVKLDKEIRHIQKVIGELEQIEISKGKVLQRIADKIVRDLGDDGYATLGWLSAPGLLPGATPVSLSDFTGTKADSPDATDEENHQAALSKWSLPATEHFKQVMVGGILKEYFNNLPPVSREDIKKIYDSLVRADSKGYATLPYTTTVEKGGKVLSGYDNPAQISIILRPIPESKSDEQIVVSNHLRDIERASSDAYSNHIRDGALGWTRVTLQNMFTPAGVFKKVWVMEEIQVDPHKNDATRNPKHKLAYLREYFFGVHFAAMEETIKLAAKNNVDEVWVATARDMVIKTATDIDSSLRDELHDNPEEKMIDEMSVQQLAEHKRDRSKQRLRFDSYYGIRVQQYEDTVRRFGGTPRTSIGIDYIIDRTASGYEDREVSKMGIIDVKKAMSLINTIEPSSKEVKEISAALVKQRRRIFSSLKKTADRLIREPWMDLVEGDIIRFNPEHTSLEPENYGVELSSKPMIVTHVRMDGASIVFEEGGEEYEISMQYFFRGSIYKIEDEDTTASLLLRKAYSIDTTYFDAIIAAKDESEWLNEQVMWSLISDYFDMVNNPDATEKHLQKLYDLIEKRFGEEGTEQLVGYEPRELDFDTGPTGYSLFNNEYENEYWWGGPRGTGTGHGYQLQNIMGPGRGRGTEDWEEYNRKQHERWKLQQEVTEHIENDTWSLVELPKKNAYLVQRIKELLVDFPDRWDEAIEWVQSRPIKFMGWVEEYKRHAFTAEYDKKSEEVWLSDSVIWSIKSKMDIDTIEEAHGKVAQVLDEHELIVHEFMHAIQSKFEQIGLVAVFPNDQDPEYLKLGEVYHSDPGELQAWTEQAREGFVNGMSDKDVFDMIDRYLPGELALKLVQNAKRDLGFAVPYNQPQLLTKNPVYNKHRRRTKKRPKRNSAFDLRRKPFEYRRDRTKKKQRLFS